MFPLRIAIVLLSSLAFAGCGEPVGRIRQGGWRIELDLNGQRLPFTWTASQDSLGAALLTIHNGDEHIIVDDITVQRDSFRARMPLFDSEFIGAIQGDSLIRGEWKNHLKGDGYRIPFTATATSARRFPTGCSGCDHAFAGNWEARFSPNTADAYNSVGVFACNAEGLITGTFLTETGDYRYLEGATCADSMHLSCFDGTHAFLFSCTLRNDSLVGRFWSGTHWQEPWVAIRNPDYRLRDPDSLTTLREGYDRVDFRFKDTEGTERSPADPEYQGKPMLVHIMGSWCPNCVDETALLTEMHRKHHANGLNILAVAFEKHADERRALAGLRRFKEVLHVPYPILYGGPAAKDKAASRLPFLNHLMSYPTCIFIDRTGRIRRIRTGFYGPGTGGHYTDYKAHLDAYLQLLLAEGAATAKR